MKRLVVLLLVLMGMPLISFSQEQVDTTAAEQARLDSIKDRMRRDSLWAVWEREYDSIRAIKLNHAKEMQEVTKFLPRYKIYQTENIYILLKLDTKEGKVWMVQYSMKDTESAEIPIKYFPIVDEDEGWNGRFELYPTKNMYNFIMVDNDDGTTYQVQWSTERSYRFIEKITSGY